ncbi:hypothetical protein F5Y17DRAFT_462044 [Xylariaceae sp. FL0594]|nr:hypothetical protein F5Y17DRAFT_462044 [Xylariaceae sp. FL0594]
MTDTTTQPIPVILCGKTVEVGEKVTPMIKPEIEVIQFINSFDDAKANLPSLLAGDGPKTHIANQVGSHDFSRPPRAVIFGRAFANEDVRELNRLCRGKGKQPVAWIAGDPSVVPPAHPGPEYAVKAADNVKRALLNWLEAGANSEDIVYY